MAKLETTLIASHLPLEGAAERLHSQLRISRGERRELFEFSNIWSHLVTPPEELEDVRKPKTPLHLRATNSPPSGRGTEIGGEAGQMMVIYHGLQDGIGGRRVIRIIRGHGNFDGRKKATG
jgi:hypothetical protein